MKIIFWGASVTQQGGASGYYEQLLSKVTATNHQFEFARFAFGGNGFDDAGFYCLNTLLNEKPDVCFIEFSTTFLTFFDDAKHRQFIDSLVSNKILPVYLILPRVHNMQGLPCITQQHNFSKELNIPILDLRDDFAPYVNSVEYLRDGVHTTEKGVEYFAEKIYSFILNSLINKTFEIVRRSNINFPLIPVHKFNIGKLSIEKRIRFFVDFAGVGDHGFFEIFAHLKIGPMSNNVEVRINDLPLHLAPIYDIWTHYERNSYKPIISNKLAQDYERVYGLKNFIVDKHANLFNGAGYVDLIPVPVTLPAPYSHIVVAAPRLDFLGDIFSSFKINGFEIFNFG